MSLGVESVSVDLGTVPFVAGDEPVVPEVELVRSGFAVMTGSVVLQAARITMRKVAGISLRMFESSYSACLHQFAYRR